MTEQLGQFLLNPWVTLVSIICGVLGVVLAIYFGIKSLPKKKIKVIISSNELITQENADISKLKIIYNEKNIESLTVTKVIFWNGSLPTINDTDIVRAVPFTVSLKTGTILDISVLKGHDTSNKIDALPLNDNTAQISFEYLDYKEGGVLQIIHTGSENSVKISKKLKGGCIKTVNQEDINSVRVGLILLSFLALDATISSQTMLELFPESWRIQKEIVALRRGYSLLINGACIIFLIGCIVFYYIKQSKGLIPKNCKKEK